MVVSADGKKSHILSRQQVSKMINFCPISTYLLIKKNFRWENDADTSSRKQQLK